MLDSKSYHCGITKTTPYFSYFIIGKCLLGIAKQIKFSKSFTMKCNWSINTNTWVFAAKSWIEWGPRFT